MTRTLFHTIAQGLKRDSFPMRLYEKAKRFGVWNPSVIDFTVDRQNWLRLSAREQQVLLHLTSLFQAGEEAVTLDILPLIQVVAAEGRLEEEMYLTTFLFEEAKHTDLFRRFLDEVVGADEDLSRFHGENYRAIVYEALPTAMGRLLVDPTPLVQIKAAVTYNMIVEGVLAETGYHAYLTALERNGLMPGQCQGIRLLKQDESRHIAYGLYLIGRLLADESTLWEAVEETMNTLLPHALGVVGDTFALYTIPPQTMPFGLQLEEFSDFALQQFQKRMAKLEDAKNSQAEIELEAE